MIAWKQSRSAQIGFPLDLPTIPKGSHWCKAPAARLVYAGTGPPFTHAAFGHSFTVRNRGRTTCVVGGRPAIELASATRGPLTIEDAGSMDPSYPDDGRPWGLRPGKTADLQIITWAVCDGSMHGDPELAATVVVAYASSRVRMPFKTCGRTGSSIDVGPLEPPPLPDEQRWRLRASIAGIPRSVHAGSTVVYHVRLSNPTAKGFRFPPYECPSAEVRVGRSDHLNDLPCRAIGTIAPRGSVLLEWHTSFVRHYPPGRYTLTWWFDQIARDTVISASAPLHVVGG